MSDGSYLESNSCSLPLPKDSLVWLGPGGKHKGYGLTLVRFFLSGGKISNCRRSTGGRHKSVSVRPQAEDVFQASQFFCLRGSQANKGLGTAPEGLGGL